MKAILLILLFINLALCQAELIPFVEIVMNTRNTGGNTVCFSANSQTYRWNAQFFLTTDYQTVNMTINGDILACYPENSFGFGNHPGEITLAHSIYTILVVNPRKSAWFKIDAMGCTFNRDIHITYDWLEDAFFIGGDCSSYGYEPINHQTVVMYCDPICFQPTTPTNLHYENANGHPRLSWNLSEPQEAATYEV